MRMKNGFLLVFLLGWLSGVSGWAARQVEFVEIPGLKRLPVNAIHRIFQDSEGYMWYGTVDGLCRDDGYQIQVFRSDFNHQGLLANNLVECVTEDGDGCVWFGTDKGAYRIDKRDYRVKPVGHELLDGQRIYQMYHTKDGDVWVSVKGALLRYRGHRLLKVYPTYNGNEPTNLSGFCEGRGGEVIVLFSDGMIYRLDKSRDELMPFPDGMRRRNPCGIVQDAEEDYYWVGTWGDGILRFSPSASPDSMFVYQEEVSDRSEEHTIYYLACDKRRHRVWATTQAGLLAYRCEGGRLRPCETGAEFPYSRVMLNDLCFSKSGDLWVSGFDTPSFILHFSEDVPERIGFPLLYDRTHYRPVVMAMHDDGDGVFWLYQERSGVFLDDLEKERLVSHTDFLSTCELPFGLVKLMVGSRMPHAVWVAPDFSKEIFRLSHEDFRMRLSDRVDLSAWSAHQLVTALCESTDGKTLWIGTDNGVLCYDLRGKNVRREYARLGHVTDFCISPRQGLWVATNNRGLYLIRPDGSLCRYGMTQALSSLTQAGDGNLWLGSEEGDLLSFSPSERVVRNYNRECNLNGDVVNQVVADEFGHIWVGMNQMVMEFNPQNGSYRTFPTTDASIGLWRIIPSAWCVGRDGCVYFGGISGICRFRPSNSLDRAAEPARVVVTDVRVDNRSLFFDGGRNSFGVDSVVDVGPETGRVVVCFSSLDHLRAHKIRYAYRLKGIDHAWQYTTSGQNSAIYNRLPCGDYEFEVKATDANGQWSRLTTVMKVRRLPAWYETWWFYFMCFVVLAGGLSWAVAGYVGRQKRRNAELWGDSAEMLRMKRYLDVPVGEESPEETESLDKLLLEKAVAAVEGHLADGDFDVQRLAEAMNMSRSTLTRKLKTITGDTPLEFIRHIKMKHARRLLSDKRRNVSEVAVELGYQNRKYFTACFKDEFGMTPSEFQKNLPG